MTWDITQPQCDVTNCFLSIGGSSALRPDVQSGRSSRSMMKKAQGASPHLQNFSSSV